MKHSSLSAALAASVFACVLAACASSKPVEEVAPPLPPPPPPPSEFVEKLDSDGLFGFGKADIRDISDEGRASLDALAARLSADPRPLESINVIGHSDRIGNSKVNVRVSTRRAEAVRDYLVERGVPAETIEAVGRGDAEPVVECSSERGQALIACLAPNRRVEVQVKFVN